MATIVLCLALVSTLNVQADQVPTWQIMKLSQQKNNQSVSRGLLMYTTGADKTGAAFRCEGGRLYTFVAVKPADFRKVLQQRSSHPYDREVSFSLNSADEVSEEWVQMFRGQIYMVRKTSTTLDIFRTATTDSIITFTRKYGKTVVIPLPAMERGISRHFLESCELSAAYRP